MRAEGQNKFRSDLERTLRLTLTGDSRGARAIAAPAADALVAQLPSLHVITLAGRSLALASQRDRVVVVEFWATWCPPCRSTLRRLSQLRSPYGDKPAVVAFAVESPEPAVKKLTDELGIPVTWVIVTPQSAPRAFADVSAVPTLHLFAPGGAAARSCFGATPDLHARRGEYREARALKGRHPPLPEQRMTSRPQGPDISPQDCRRVRLSPRP